MGYDMYIEGIPQEDKERARKLGKEASALYQQRNNRPEDQHPQRSADLWGFQEGTGSDEWWELHKKAEAHCFIGRTDEWKTTVKGVQNPRRG